MEKIKINMTDEVNNAIIEVITHHYKKDCPEAHKLVKDWGYTIEKVEGNFRVKNDHTLKCVYMDYYNGLFMYGHNVIYDCDKTRLYKINFVKYLNTCYNDYLYNSHGYLKYPKRVSDAVEKYKVLRLAKHNAKFCRDEIILQDEKLKMAIENYQNQTKYYKEQAEKHDKEIADLRKEYGLTK